MNFHFTKEEQKEINKRLRNLEKICRPTGLLFPEITFKTKEDFDYFDVLQTYENARIEPADLRQMWESQEHLNARGLGYLIINNEKWFYDKVSPISRIFSQDGTKMIAIDFPCFTHTPKIWSMPETKPIIKNLINACQQNFPPKVNTQTLFSDEFCQKLYDKTGANEPPEIAVMEMMETLRRILVAKLIQQNQTEIKKTKAYQKFIKNQPNNQNNFIEFLRQNKNLIFMLSEKLGYIQNAKALIRYHQKRDHARHPDEVVEINVRPHKILDDFYKALKMKKIKTQATPSLNPIYKNMETSMAFDGFVELRDVLLDKINHKYKYDKKAFWQELEQQKVLREKESKHLQKIIKRGNRVAHANPHADAAKTQLVDQDHAFIGRMLSKLLNRPY